MKKKDIIVILLVMFVLSGCGKKAKDNNKHICEKKGIERTESVSEISYIEDVTNSAIVNDEGKLTYYSTLYHYTYNSKEDCFYWCDIKTKWNNDINSQFMNGGRRETKCTCDNHDLTEEYLYTDILHLDKTLRSDINELNDDNTFRLDEWTQKYEKIGYNCS